MPTPSKDKRNNVVSMHEHIISSSKSLDWKDSHVCNLGTIIEPLITKEACVNGSGVEKIDGSEPETDVLSIPLESKGIFDPIVVSLLSREKKTYCVWVGRQKAWDWNKNNRNIWRREVCKHWWEKNKKMWVWKSVRMTKESIFRQVNFHKVCLVFSLNFAWNKIIKTKLYEWPKVLLMITNWIEFWRTNIIFFQN